MAAYAKWLHSVLEVTGSIPNRDTALWHAFDTATDAKWPVGTSLQRVWLGVGNSQSIRSIDTDAIVHNWQGSTVTGS